MSRIVISGVNLDSGGTLSVMQDCLCAFEETYSDEHEIIAIVHRARLFKSSKIRFIEYPIVKKSWFIRILVEYIFFFFISLKLKPTLWLSMHDMTPLVWAKRQAVYCHNPAPFSRPQLSNIYNDPKFFFFTLLYALIYRVNIRKNTFVIVQQQWLRDEFIRRFKVKNVIVSHPSLVENKDRWSIEPTKEKTGFTFCYPAFPRIFKNFELLIDAAALLVEHGYVDFSFLLTIDGEENRYSRSILKKARELSQVRFIGRQSRADIFKLYLESDALIFPSKLETWGMPITEFKQTGKPIFLARTRYSAETIGEYRNVSFFDPNDANALYLSIASFMSGSIKMEATEEMQVKKPFVGNWTDLCKMLMG